MIIKLDEVLTNSFNANHKIFLIQTKFEPKTLHRNTSRYNTAIKIKGKPTGKKVNMLSDIMVKHMKQVKRRLRQDTVGY